MEKEFIKKSKEQLRKELTDIEYAVTQENATERPYTNKYDEHFEKGLYVDITTGEPLFTSLDKFNSGCGWPAFTNPISRSNISEKVDKTHGMVRTEVRSKTGDAHLGHVFCDGPLDKGGLRYCINSASLNFIAFDELDSKGYAEYKKYFK